AVGVEDRPQVLVRAEPRNPLARYLRAVAHEAPQLDADVRPPAEHPHDFGRDLAAAHDEAVAQDVAAATREAQGLTENRARQTDGGDREHPEIKDDQAGVLVATEEEGHDRDQHQDADRRGLGDIDPLRQVRAEPTRPVETKGTERHGPHGEDRQELEGVALEVWKTELERKGPHDVEAEEVCLHPARADKHEVAREAELGEQARKGLQHTSSSLPDFSRRPKLRRDRRLRRLPYAEPAR